MSTTVRFLPWVRAKGPIENAIQVRAAGQDISVPFSRYGPGDVTGIGPGQITRREPSPDSLGMPPNLFPYVEFARPDFPWCVSPGVPDATGRLTPWIALLVVESHEGTPLSTIADAKQAVIEIPLGSLPLPTELALWTHVQLDAEVAVSPNSIGLGIARVLSPRALRPNTRYVACVVPSFDAGRLAGLGKPVADARAADPAWSAGTGTVVLPVYDHWFFTTTDTGDLETLARRLKGRDLAGTSAPKLLDVSAVSGNVAGELAPFEGALRPLGTAAAWAGPAVGAAATRLASMISRTTASAIPAVGPPIYGSIASGRTATIPGWLNDLNLDPRRRAAAGLGASIVRAYQDELVDEAWRQVGDMNRARREHVGAILAEFAGGLLHDRSIAPLSGPSALVTLAPALARIRDPSFATAAAKLESSTIPAPLLSPAFRRILLTKTSAATRRAGHGITRTLIAQNQAVVSPGEMPPTPSKLVTQAHMRAVLDAASPTAGTGVSTAGAAASSVSTADPGNLSTSVSTGVIRTLPLKLSESQAALLDSVVAQLDARKPAIVEVRRPKAFAWLRPAGTVTPLATPTARFARRVDFGEGARLRAGVGIVATPRFNQALSAWLDPGFLLEGVNIPVDTAGMLAVNTEFIEALMVGANHELARELLWRGVPLDRTITPLTRFFESRASNAPRDMTAIRRWTPASALGSHVDLGERVVLLLRSRLVSRLNETVIYLAKAEPDGQYRKPGSTQLLPLFRGNAGLDTAYLGFELGPADLVADFGWYVVIQELPHAPRFGFDEDGPPSLATWNDLAWPRVAAPTGYVVSTPPPPIPASSDGLQWGLNSAHMAAISLQHPIRVSIHSSLLTTGEN